MKPKKSNLIINLIGIVVSFTAVIAVFYAWLIPRFFIGLQTYSVFVTGICGAAILGGTCCVKANKAITATKYGYLLPIFVGLIVGGIVMFFSLLVILNVRGS